MLFSCAVYVSSGASSIAARVATAARTVPKVAVVDTFTDTAYARSSVKLVAEPEYLLRAACAAAVEGLGLVDLSREPHPAPHPRQGAIDMVSFMPLTEQRAEAIDVELQACDSLAWRLGEKLGAVGCPVLMYGPRSGRSLLQTRRGTSFFASCRKGMPREATTSLALDFGELAVDGSLPQETGVSIIGVQPYVTNFNIQVENSSLEACRSAAAALRTTFGVQVMALPHAEGTCEIGCNLQATQEHDCPARDAVLSFVIEALPAGARVRHSSVIGLSPDEAKAMGEQMLLQQHQ